MHASLTEWWNGISLRTRITGVTVLIMTIGLAVSGFGTMTLLRDTLLQDVDAQIKAAVLQVDPSSLDRKGPSDYVVAVFDASGALTGSNKTWNQHPPSMPTLTLARVEELKNHPFTVRESDGTAAFRIAVTPLGSGWAALGLPLATTNNVIARLFTLFFLFGVVVVVVGAVLTRLLVGSAFAPLRQVERTAAAIADGDFGQRLGNTTANTEVGRLNRSLNRMLNRIDRALTDRARTIEQMRRFVGDASHELRTPLVSVRGYAELYRMGALQSREDVAQAMDRIEREAVRLGSLVSDLLALARLDESKPMTPKPVELLPLAHDAALDARALAPKRLIRVIGHDPDVPTGAIEVLPPVALAVATPEATTTASRPWRRENVPADATSTGSLRMLLRARRRFRDDEAVSPPPVSTRSSDALPLVLAEEDKLRQVLANLVGNAIRFTPDDSPIEIAAYADSARGLAFLEVIDHGEGIPPQIREKIFQRFWRADSSRTRDTGGSGLGLAIVAAIVNAHNGTIGISETPGGGATFRLALPLLTNDRPDEVLNSDADAA
jgi:two-component system, OmpR family, sensor kinase